MPGLSNSDLGQSFVDLTVLKSAILERTKEPRVAFIGYDDMQKKISSHRKILIFYASATNPANSPDFVLGFLHLGTKPAPRHLSQSSCRNGFDRRCIFYPTNGPHASVKQKKSLINLSDKYMIDENLFCNLSCFSSKMDQERRRNIFGFFSGRGLVWP